MASVASQLIDEVTAHVQRDSVEDAREICADGTYFLNNLRILYCIILYYIILIHTIVLQLPTLFSTVTCCTCL